MSPTKLILLGILSAVAFWCVVAWDWASALFKTVILGRVEDDQR